MKKIKAQKRQTGKNIPFGVRSFEFTPCLTTRSEFLRALMFSAIKWEYYYHPYQRTVVKIRWEGEK